jgi:hypothetical protein
MCERKLSAIAISESMVFLKAPVMCGRFAMGSGSMDKNASVQFIVIR